MKKIIFGNSTTTIFGRLFDIQRMSFNDGPGIRTSVFMKGCTMRCFWCHNPESWRPEKELQYFPEQCIRCGACIEICPNGCHSASTTTHLLNRTHCTSCFQCSQACPSGSLLCAGKDIGIDALVLEVMRDRAFFERSGGGITFTGGEPLMQAQFVAEACRRIQKLGVTTAIETAANVKYTAFKEVIPYTDYFIVDLKHPDSIIHKKVTGVDNDLIINNLTKLNKTAASYIVRIPLIPGVNNTPEVMCEFDKIFAKLSNLTKVELMPFHPLGVNKHLSLGLDISKTTQLQQISNGELDELAKVFRAVPVEFKKN